jgi:spermidine synthase
VALFTLSGTAGLLHEVAWARLLGQVLGTSPQALAAVLASFLGGLALGGSAGARLAGRVRRPLLAYASIEFMLAGFGLLAPVVASWLPAFLEAAGPGWPDGAPLLVLRSGIATILLVPAALAMGATLPIVVREGTRSGAPAGTAVAILYGANTIGGALGACLGSFGLLPFAGSRLTFGAAALLNLLAGTGAALLARAAADEAPEADPEPSGPAAAGVAAGPGAAAFVAGLLAAALQFGWIRVASLSFGSSVYALGSTLTACILGLGAGPLLVARSLAVAARGRRVAGAGAIVAGFLSLLLLPLFGALPVLAARLAGSLGDRPTFLIGAQFGVLALLLLLPATAHGTILPSLVAAARDRGGPAHACVGRLYAASTWGAVAGFLLAAHAGLPCFGTRGTLLGTSVAAVLLGAALLVPDGFRGAAPGIGCVVAALALAAALPGWDRSVLSGGGFLYGAVYRGASLSDADLAGLMRRRGKILFYRDAGDSLVTVRRNPAGVLSMQINGKTEASSGGDMPTQVLAAHLPLLLHRQPREVLVIGLASGVTAGSALAYPVDRVEVIEISPAVAEAAALFADVNHNALADPRLRLRLDDARARLLVRPRRFDAIVSQPSNPWVAGVANLFTVEFYLLLKRRLAPGGIACQWLQAYRLAPADFRSIVRTFLQAFPDATLWEESPGGGDYFLIGADGPLRVDPERLRAASASPAWDDLRRVGIEGPADVLARFVAGPAALRALAADAPLHTDDRLFLETRAPLALFRDTLREQVAMLRPIVEPVAAILPPGALRADPVLAAALAALRRQRQERLDAAASLRDADLWSLRDPYLAAGLDALRGGRPVEAIRALVEAVRRDPASGTAHFLLAEAYRAAGLAGPAEVALRQAVRVDPGLAPAWNALGRVLSARGDDGEARAAFESALGADPRLAIARANLGALLLGSGDRRGAEVACRAALDLDPLLAPAWANLALVLKQRGDLAGAEACVRRALELDPLNADARYNLAIVLQTAGRTAAARDELRRLLADDPTDREAARLLGRLSG